MFLISLALSAFAYEWFDNRYFETSLGARFGISNNAMQISDVLTKNVVIDLKKMADDMPESGLTFSSYLVPELGFKLDLRKFQIGMKSGADVWWQGTLSKDLFDYLGNGNTLYQTVSVSQYLNMDVFAYQEFSVGFKIKQFTIVAKPAIFMPIFHVASSNGTLSVTNLSDGSLNVDYSSDMEIYSAFGISGESGFSGGVGFDIAGSVSYPLFDFLTLTGSIRLPVIPGKLGYKTVQTTTMNFSTTIDKIVNGSLGTNDFSSSHEDSVSTSYFINRPLKLNALAELTPFGDWVIFTGGLGIGFRHPFTDDMESFEVFGEYYLAGTLNFLKCIKLIFSSECFEGVFIHQFTFSADVRVFELVLGINAQSSDFVKSCSGGGVGGVIGMKFGY